MDFNEEYLRKKGLTKEEIEKSILLYNIAKEISSKNMVLKGGTSLLLGYGLNRWSKDLDFDTTGNKRYKNDFLKAFKNQGLKYGDIHETEIDTRIINTILYDKTKSIKLEVEYNSKYFQEGNNIVNRNGVFMYDIKTLSQMKYEMLMDHKRAHDIFDTAFLIHHFPKNYKEWMLYNIKNRIDKLGIDNIKKSFKMDEVVKRFNTGKIIDDLSNDINKLLIRYEKNKLSYSNGNNGNGGGR